MSEQTADCVRRLVLKISSARISKPQAGFEAGGLWPEEKIRPLKMLYMQLTMCPAEEEEEE